MMDLLPLLLLGLAFKAKRAQHTAEELEFFPKKFHYDKQNKKLLFVMEILNPTSNRLKVDSVFAGVFAGSNKIGSVERGEPFTLEPNKRTEVRFPVKPQGIGIAKALIDAVKGVKQDFTILGTVKALGIETALNETIPLSL